MLKKSIVLATFASAMFALAGTASAADLADGKATFDSICSKCHEIGDWKGKSEADLNAKITGFVQGKEKHKKDLKLTDAQIANVSAFIASSK